MISHSVSRQSFNTDATGTANFSVAQQDRGTLYAPTGQILGYPVIITQFHISFANGVFVTASSQFRLIRSPC